MNAEAFNERESEYSAFTEIMRQNKGIQEIISAAADFIVEKSRSLHNANPNKYISPAHAVQVEFIPEIYSGEIVLWANHYNLNQHCEAAVALKAISQIISEIGDAFANDEPEYWLKRYMQQQLTGKAMHNIYFPSQAE